MKESFQALGAYGVILTGSAVFSRKKALDKRGEKCYTAFVKIFTQFSLGYVVDITILGYKYINGQIVAVKLRE